MRSPATPRELRRFGVTLAIAFAAVAAFARYRGAPGSPWLFAGAAALLLLALVAPLWLRGFARGWMRLAEVLGTISTYVVLTLTFLLVITPAGLLVRLAGKSAVSKGFEQGRASYWEPVDAAAGPATRPHRPF